MITTRTKKRGFKKVTIEDVKTETAVKHYFAYQGREDIKYNVILTKKF